MRIKKTALFGASFGGALALILHKEFAVRNVFLSSPLLDLENQRKRGGKEYSEWFASRFSARDFKHFGFQSLATSVTGAVHMTYGREDEVLGSEFFKKIKGWKVFPRSGGHVPRTYNEYLCQKLFFTRAALIIKAV